MESRSRFPTVGLCFASALILVFIAGSAFADRRDGHVISPSRGSSLMPIDGRGQDNGTGSDAQDPAETENETEIQGTVSAIDCSSHTMTVTTESGDVDVTLQDSTTFKEQGNVVPCDNIQVGDNVEVSGTQDGSILADKVTIEAPEVEETEITGTIKAGSIDSVALTFIVTTDTGDVKIQTNSETIFRQDGDLKTFGDLADGMSVEVEGFLQGDGSIVATRVSIEGSED